MRFVVTCVTRPCLAALSNHRVGIEVLFCLVSWNRRSAWARGEGQGTADVGRVLIWYQMQCNHKRHLFCQCLPAFFKPTLLDFGVPPPWDPLPLNLGLKGGVLARRASFFDHPPPVPAPPPPRE